MNQPEEEKIAAQFIVALAENDLWQKKERNTKKKIQQQNQHISELLNKAVKEEENNKSVSTWWGIERRIAKGAEYREAFHTFFFVILLNFISFRYTFEPDDDDQYRRIANQLVRRINTL